MYEQGGLLPRTYLASLGAILAANQEEAKSLVAGKPADMQYLIIYTTFGHIPHKGSGGHREFLS